MFWDDFPLLCPTIFRVTWVQTDEGSRHGSMIRRVCVDSLEVCCPLDGPFGLDELGQSSALADFLQMYPQSLFSLRERWFGYIKTFMLTHNWKKMSTNQWELQWRDQRLARQRSQHRMDKSVSPWPLTPLTLFLHPGHHQPRKVYERRRKEERGKQVDRRNNRKSALHLSFVFSSFSHICQTLWIFVLKSSFYNFA